MKFSAFGDLKGRALLVEKTSDWQRLTCAIGLILSGKAASGVEAT
jgi:hypothetical protein